MSFLGGIGWFVVGLALGLAIGLRQQRRHLIKAIALREEIIRRQVELSQQISENMVLQEELRKVNRDLEIYTIRGDPVHPPSLN